MSGKPSARLLFKVVAFQEIAMMDWGLMDILTAVNMKVFSKMVNLMEMEYFLISMVIFIKEVFFLDFQMEKVKCLNREEKHIRVFGKKANLLEIKLNHPQDGDV